MTNLQGPDLLKLLIAVDELNIQELITFIQEYMIKHEFLQQNSVAEFISVYPDIRLTSIRFNPDIQLIYPDNIRISRILSGYPKLSGYPANLSGYPGYLLKFFILSFVNDNLI